MVERNAAVTPGIAPSAADRVFGRLNALLLTLAVIAVVYPLVFAASASISNPVRVMDGEVWLLPRDVTLKAYGMIFSDRSILVGYRNTIVYTVVGTSINLLMTIAGAYPLSRRDFAGRRLLTAFFTFTLFFNGGLIPTYLLVKSLGMLNTLWVLVLPTAVGVWNLLIMRTFFQVAIPAELQEAAFMDGCSNVRTLLQIVLPLSTAIVAVMVMFYGVAHWNSYFAALIYVSDRNRYPLQLVLREILIQNQMNAMMAGTDVDSFLDQILLAEGLKYAVIVVASVPMLVLYPFLQRYFVKGVMLGAIKG